MSILTATRPINKNLISLRKSALYHNCGDFIQNVNLNTHHYINTNNSRYSDDILEINEYTNHDPLKEIYPVLKQST